MNQGTRIIWNVFTNYGRQIILIVVALLLNPYLFHGLGEDAYGIIALVGLTGGLLMLLDAGLAHAISRFVSKHKAIGDVDEINRVVTTSVAVYSLTGLLALAAVVCVGLYFLEQLGVPDTVIVDARYVFIIVAFALAIRFPGNAFEGVLKGLQRFDLSNAAQITERLIYAGSAFLLIGLFKFGVVAVACGILAGSLAAQLLRFFLAHRIHPELKVGWKWLSRRVFRETFSFGSMAFLTQISTFLENTIARAVISATLGSTLLGSFNLVIVLSGLLRQTRISTTNVVMPVASKYETLKNEDKLRLLLFTGSRLLLSIIFPIGIWIVVMSKTILLTWIGPELLHVTLLLSLFAIIEMLEASNGVGHMVLLGMGRAKFLGIAYAVSSVLGLGILSALVLCTELGLYSAAIGLGSGVAVRRTLVLIHMCRCLRVAPTLYLYRIILPVLITTAITGAVSLIAKTTLPVAGWNKLVLSAALAGIVHLPAVWFLILQPEEKRWLIANARPTLGNIWQKIQIRKNG